MLLAVLRGVCSVRVRPGTTALNPVEPETPKSQVKKQNPVAFDQRKLKACRRDRMAQRTVGACWDFRICGSIEPYLGTPQEKGEVKLVIRPCCEG